MTTNYISVIQRVEKAYGLPFKDVIGTVHWKQEIPIAEIADRSEVSRTAILHHCEKLNISTRKKPEADRIRTKKMYQKNRSRVYPR